MAYAAKSFALLARSIASVSNKLSIAAVLGLATLPVLPQGAASGSGAGDPRPAVAPIEMVRARPVPIAEEPAAEPTFQLAARRSRVKREPAPEAEEQAAPEPASPAAAKETAKSARSPSHKTSSISQPEAEKIPLPPAIRAQACRRRAGRAAQARRVV